MGVFDVSLGPLLLGTILNVTLLGMMIMQVYLYIGRFWGKDDKWINYMVAFVFFADIVNSALDVTFVYQYTITNFGNMQAIQISNWVFNSDPVMTVILSSVCQGFFAWRVKLLTGRRWLFSLLVIAILIQLLMGIATTIATTIVKVFLHFQRFRVIVIIWLVLSSVTDTAIAATLVWYLRSHRTGYAATDSVLTKLTRITVETGMVTAIWATVDLIVYLTFPNSLHLIFNLPLGKLYTNSLMSTLNSRSNWGSESDHDKTTMGVQKLSYDHGIGLQKMSTGTAQRVLWARGGQGAPGITQRPESVNLSGVKTTRENGILITSSTVVHRDEDDYVLEHEDDNDAKPEFFVNDKSGRHAFASPELKSDNGVGLKKINGD